MRRQLSILSVVLAGLVVAGGCRPQQPFHFQQRGDMAQYMDVATEIEYPDIQTASLEEVNQAKAPFTLDNQKPESYWNLTLEESIQIALTNGSVLRSLGGQTSNYAVVLQGGGVGLSDFLLRLGDNAPTVYLPAITETNGRSGVEAALAAFDSQFQLLADPQQGSGWGRRDRPSNRNEALGGFIRTFEQADNAAVTAQIQKTNATGGTWRVTHGLEYNWDNTPFNPENLDNTIKLFPSDWQSELALEVRQPLLRGAGVAFNRIAGPAGSASAPGINNGVLIARIGVDQSLSEFEASVRNFVSDVEKSYWLLYLQYRSVDAARAGRDAALQTWRNVRAKQEAGARGGSAQEEAQARHQYYEFESQLQDALTNLYRQESSVRYMMGLTTNDGRLIRPSDEPTTAKIEFDWHNIHSEALVRSAELRIQKWTVKRREMELIASKSWLLPQLDAVAQYRWRGMGNHLFGGGGDFPGDEIRSQFPNAYDSLTSGRFEEWNLGFALSFPFGYRREMANVRNAELGLIHSRKVLQEMELETSHLLSDALRDVSRNHHVAESRFNQRAAAMTEVRVLEEKYRAGAAEATLDIVLDAQRRLAVADQQYYNALVQYNLSVTYVHLRKGSLLEYNGVFLAEGPWPAKAYFDAVRRARARDAAKYIDYGFTRPKVLSQGPIEQQAGAAGGQSLASAEGGLMPEAATPEANPTAPADGAEIVPPAEPLPPSPRPREEVIPSAAPEAGTPPAELPSPLRGTPKPQPQAKVLRPPTTKTFDLGALDLNALADKPSATVQPAGYEQSTTAASDSGKGWTRKR